MWAADASRQALGQAICDAHVSLTVPAATAVGVVAGRRGGGGAPARRDPFSPHMTIAEFITMEQGTTLLRTLASEELEGRFSCTEVVYAVPDATFHFSERMSWPLGPSGPLSGHGVGGVTA